MRIKYSISLIVFVAIVIIEKENNIISRVSDKLISKQNHQTTLQSNSSTCNNDSWFMKQGLDNYTEHMALFHGGRKHILLLATTRTGSSFVGELFNQQGDDMFYLFEPLWHVEKKLTLVSGGTNATVASPAYRDVLQQLFLCDFNLLESFIHPPPLNHISPALFRRDSSIALCEKSVCSPFVKKVFEPFRCKSRRCGPLNLTLASESCHKKKHRAIKSVRVRQLETLRPLTEDPRLDIKFIQLVRDPRAILASRMVAFSSKYKNWKKLDVNEEVPIDDEEVQKLKGNCDNIRMSAEVGLSRPSWLHQRYMLVRYEDIARYPMKKASEMYKFTGIPFTPQVKTWIQKNTEVSDEARSAFSTHKNSSDHVEKWRFSIPFKLVQLVQKICRPTLTMFGYKLAKDEAMLIDKSISLIEEKSF